MLAASRRGANEIFASRLAPTRRRVDEPGLLASPADRRARGAML
jgi:hypothetical protein